MPVKFGKKSTPSMVSEYAKHLDSSPLVGEVSVLKKSGKAEEKLGHSSEEQLHPGVVLSEGELIHIQIEGGATINLGNYESARIAVTIRIPCTSKTLEEVYAWGTDWVSGKIKEAVADAKGG